MQKAQALQDHLLLLPVGGLSGCRQGVFEPLAQGRHASLHHELGGAAGQVQHCLSQHHGELQAMLQWSRLHGIHSLPHSAQRDAALRVHQALQGSFLGLHINLIQGLVHCMVHCIIHACPLVLVSSLLLQIGHLRPKSTASDLSLRLLRIWLANFGCTFLAFRLFGPSTTKSLLRLPFLWLPSKHLRLLDGPLRGKRRFFCGFLWFRGPVSIAPTHTLGSGGRGFARCSFVGWIRRFLPCLFGRFFLFCFRTFRLWALSTGLLTLAFRSFRSFRFLFLFRRRSSLSS
mmetsp:Transcript_63283/g.128498  ORF Transcript_63283/g.128498 Transcript_63283/m.128498 type:complete len:287 (+) Transcript_63283:313-1173(+)